MFEGKAVEARCRQDLAMQAAWTCAALGRIKKLPPLKTLLSGPAKRPKQQSWQTMYAVAAGWAAESGIINSERGAA